MRVLYIDQYFSTRAGISGTRGYEFARNMVQQGHKVTMITSASRYSSLFPQRQFIRRLNIEGIDVISLRVSYSHLMSFARRLWAFASFMILAIVLGVFQKRHDVVFATSTPLSVGVPGLLISLIRGTPFVFEVRDLWPKAPIELGVIKNQAAITLLRFLEKILYRHARHIVTLSPGMKDGIVARGISPEKVTVIPNACDLDLFSDLPDRNALRKEFGWEHKFVAVYAGAVGIANDLGYMLDVAAAYRKMGKDGFHLVIIGEGNDLPRVREKARNLELDFVEFIGPVTREKVAQYISCADIGLTIFKDLPVLATNSPNKFFDYLAAGIPVAVNSPGWTRAVVEENGAGIYLPANDLESAAHRLSDLQKDNGRRKKMARAAMKLAKEKYERGVLLVQMLEVLEEAAARSASGVEYAVKSALDIIFALAVVVILSPVFLAVALAVKLDSSGPIFFTQKRVGKNGRGFTMIKFRTMIHGADKLGLGLNVGQGDDRITQSGRFLREWSLDELPQVFNILFRHMSLIGPRPALAEHVSRYDETQRKRLQARPGLTGLSQVSGRNALSWEDRLALDVRYVREYSLWLDIRIFFKTFAVVLSREGLYENHAGLDDDFNKFE